jgi:hypothetical protein
VTQKAYFPIRHLAKHTRSLAKHSEFWMPLLGSPILCQDLHTRQKCSLSSTRAAPVLVLIGKLSRRANMTSVRGHGRDQRKARAVSSFKCYPPSQFFTNPLDLRCPIKRKDDTVQHACHACLLQIDGRTQNAFLKEGDPCVALFLNPGCTFSFQHDSS